MSRAQAREEELIVEEGEEGSAFKPISALEVRSWYNLRLTLSRLQE